MSGRQTMCFTRRGTLFAIVLAVTALLWFAASAHAEEIVVFDTDECSMVVTGFEGDGADGFAMDVRFENKTDDTTLMFSMENSSLNGCMVDTLCVEEVTPGNAAVEQVVWYPSELEAYGLGAITDVSFGMRVYDSDDWSADNLVDDYFTVYPAGEQTGVSSAYEVPADADVLVDDENVSFAVLGFEGDGTSGFTMRVYVENRTDVTLMVSTDDESLNGWMCSPMWATQVAPGKVLVADVEWGDYTLEPYGFSDIADVEFTFKAYDVDNLMADDYANEHVRLYPLGEGASADHEREAQPDDVVLVDEGGVKITYIGSDVDDLGGYVADVCLENDTDRPLMFTVDEAAVNGSMCDPFWAVEVQPGKKALSDISWSESALEDVGLTPEDVADIELYLRAYDAEDWVADDVVNAVVEI